MRHIQLCLSLLAIAAIAAFATSAHAQAVRMPTPVTPTYQPPPAALPYSSPATVATPPATYPMAAQPPAFAPFDPYAQPAQYVAPPPPPVGAVPYATTPAPPPAIAFPSLPSSWGGFYAGFEGTVLEARTGAFSIPGATVTFDGFPVNASLDFQPDFDFEFSPRVWAGYKGAAGFGVRGRWWWYDHSGAGNFDIGNLPEGDDIDLDGDLALDDALNLNLRSDLRFNVIDLEGTQDGEFHNWDFQVSGGVRFADIDYDLNGNIVGSIDHLPAPAEFDGTITASADFKGVGPTIAFGGRRPLSYVDGLAFLMNLRISFLFGDSESHFSSTGTNVAITGLPDAVNFEDSIQSWEAQIGFEYSRQLASGARLFGGAYLEGQIWEWGFPTGISSNDIGFFGPTFTVGIAR